MEKVKLTKEQHDAIELLHVKGCTNVSIVSAQVDNCLLRVNGYEHIAKMNTDTLIRALYIGYEVELTVEERLIAFYNEQVETDGLDQMATEAAIIEVLDIIGMKVRGIND